MENSNVGKELLNISPKELKILSVVISLAILAYIYAHYFTNGFFYDDLYLIQQNNALHSLKNTPMFFTDVHAHGSRPDYQIYYRPFFLLSFAIDYWLGHGFNTVILHVHTFIGFLVLIVLIFLFARKLFGHITDKPFYPALFVAACFAFHPVVADVINYHTTRDMAFSTLYGMLYIVLYLYSGFCRKYYIYLVPLVIGCLFMAPAMMFMPLLWLYVVFFESKESNLVKSIKSTFRQMLPGLITVTAASALVFLVSKPTEAGNVSMFTYILTQPHVILNYFVLFFNPENINPNAWRDFVTSPFDYHFITGSLFIFVLLLTTYLCTLKKPLRPVAFGMAWFLLCLLPTHSVLPLRIAQNDYHMFPCVIGLAIALVSVVMLVMASFKTDGKSAKPILVCASIVFLMVMAYGSRQRVKVWSSDKAMWLDVVKKDPTNGRVLMNIGVDDMAEGNINEAETYFERAKAFSPYYDLLYVNIGIIKDMQHDTAAAEADFKYAVTLKGWDYASCCFFYARFLHEHGRDADAITMLNASLGANQGITESWNMLMDIYATHKNKQLAAVCRQRLSLVPDDAIAANYLKQYVADSSVYTNAEIPNSAVVQTVGNMVQPTASTYITLSLQFYKNGEYQKCIDACRKALLLDSNSAIAYNNICAAANQLKHWDEAIDAGKKALKLQPGFTMAKNNLDFAVSQKSARK